MNSPKLWLRVLRPLLWWALLVLLMFGYRQHEKWLGRTFITFNVSLNGRALGFEATTTLDGNPVLSGRQLSPGPHRLDVTCPNAEPFSKTFFAWYGRNDLGNIALKRSQGVLSVEASPPAALLAVQGAEFSVKLTNSPGLTSSVPTGNYVVEAKYAHWQKREEVAVLRGLTAAKRIAPPFGIVLVSCNYTDAVIEVFDARDRLVKSSTPPLAAADLLEGTYRAIARRQGNQQTEKFDLKAGITNTIQIDFTYGTATLETEPAGATVSDGNNHTWGRTPLTLSELASGDWMFDLRLTGYEPVQVSLTVMANQTVTIRTNLFSREYVSAINTARQYMAQLDYVRASESANRALQVKPNDSTAEGLRRQASGFGSLRRAAEHAKQGNYTAAVAEAESAAAALPDNEEAGRRVTEYRQALHEQQAKAEEEKRAEAILRRSQRTVTYFTEWMKIMPNSGLFDTQRLHLKGKLADIEARLIPAMTNGSTTLGIIFLEHERGMRGRYRGFSV